jgi:hypothetical protein
MAGIRHVNANGSSRVPPKNFVMETSNLKSLDVMLKLPNHLLCTVYNKHAPFVFRIMGRNGNGQSYIPHYFANKWTFSNIFIADDYSYSNLIIQKMVDEIKSIEDNHKKRFLIYLQSIEKALENSITNIRRVNVGNVQLQIQKQYQEYCNFVLSIGKHPALSQYKIIVLMDNINCFQDNIELIGNENWLSYQKIPYITFDKLHGPDLRAYLKSFFGRICGTDDMIILDQIQYSEILVDNIPDSVHVSFDKLHQIIDDCNHNFLKVYDYLIEYHSQIN